MGAPTATASESAATPIADSDDDASQRKKGDEFDAIMEQLMASARADGGALSSSSSSSSSSGSSSSSSARSSQAKSGAQALLATRDKKNVHRGRVSPAAPLVEVLRATPPRFRAGDLVVVTYHMSETAMDGKGFLPTYVQVSTISEAVGLLIKVFRGTCMYRFIHEDGCQLRSRQRYTEL